MKKLLIFAVIMAVSAGYVYSATATRIDDEVRRKMDEIEKSGKKGTPVEKEITIKRGAKKEEPVTSGVRESAYIQTLAALNITGGIIEGGMIGAACGLIGYSQSMNRDVNSLTTGAIIGSSVGAGLGAILSIIQANTQRYSASNDFGYNLLGGLFIGSVFGAAGGAISYGRTKDLENVSEGIGYGAAIGSSLGFILAFVEMMLPEELRSRASGHAFNIRGTADRAVLVYEKRF
ncbi:MAG TPA: hypothetical protein ENN43_05780 [bacterium]|nr:hypothetical protein [bacterium]